MKIDNCHVLCWLNGDSPQVGDDGTATLTGRVSVPGVHLAFTPGSRATDDQIRTEKPIEATMSGLEFTVKLPAIRSQLT